jgi:hypothetical protein
MKITLFFIFIFYTTIAISQTLPIWPIQEFDTSGTVAYGTFDYTSEDTTSIFYRPDLNILGINQPVKDESWIIIPRLYNPSVDTFVVIFHGGGFRVGDADFSVDEAIEITRETGYGVVIIEYPRGYSWTDPSITGDTLKNEWFCTLSTDSITDAIELAIDYSKVALDAVAALEIRYKSDSSGACAVIGPYNIIIEDEPPGPESSITCELVKPRAVLLIGNSAGGALVYENVLFNNSKERWNVIGAISLWGAFGKQRFDENGGSIPYQNVPILAVHNPCDPKSPYQDGRPFGVVPQPNNPH